MSQRHNVSDLKKYLVKHILVHLKIPSIKNGFFLCLSPLKYQTLSKLTCICAKFVTKEVFSPLLKGEMTVHFPKKVHKDFEIHTIPRHANFD